MKAYFLFSKNVIIWIISISDCQKGRLMGLLLDIWGLICTFIALHHPKSSTLLSFQSIINIHPLALVRR